MAGRGQFNALTVPVEQSAAKLSFQRFDSHAGRRGGKAYSTSTTGQAIGFGNMNKQAKIRNVKVHGLDTAG